MTISLVEQLDLRRLSLKGTAALRKTLAAHQRPPAPTSAHHSAVVQLPFHPPGLERRRSGLVIEGEERGGAGGRLRARFPPHPPARGMTPTPGKPWATKHGAKPFLRARSLDPYSGSRNRSNLIHDAHCPSTMLPSRLHRTQSSLQQAG